MRRISLALALIGAVAATGCGQTSKPANTGGNRGIESQTFKLSVRGEKRYQTGSGASLRVYMLPEGGLITGNGVNCGYNASGVPQTACEAQVAYGTPVALQVSNFYGSFWDPSAAATVSYGYYGFAGACTGSGTATGAAACSITAMNADRLVLVRFAATQSGLGAHGPYQDPAVHGLAFVTKALTCTDCHGATLGGAGNAPACAECHNGTQAYAITFPPVPAAPITKGGHFDATKMAWTDDEGGGWSTSCLRCHTGQGFLDYVGADGSPNFLGTTFKVTSTLSSTTAACEAAGTCTTGAYAYGPLKCGTCHNAASEPTATGITTIQFPSSSKDPSIPAVTTDNDTALCSQCHQGRESAVSLNVKIGTTDPDVVISPATTFVNPHYLGAAGTLFGSSGKMWGQYPGQTYAGPFLHGGLSSCTYCHDPHDGQIAIAKCGQCHTTASGAKVATLAELTASRQTGWTGDIDGDGNATESIKSEIEGLEVTLYAALRAYATNVVGTSIVYDGASHPYYFVDANGNGVRDGYVDGVAIVGFDPALADSTQYKAFTPRSLRGAFNYKWAHAEPGAWAHNARYAVQALYDSINDLNTGLGANAVPFNGTVRDTFAPAAIVLGGHFDPAGAMAGHASGDCARCHNSTAFRDYTGADGTAANYLTIGYSQAAAAAKRGTDGTTAFPTPGSFQCNACHNPLTEPIGGAGTWTRTKVFPLKTVTNLDPATAICAQCHDGARPGYEVTQLIFQLKTVAADTQLPTADNKVVRAHYLPAAATLFGSEASNYYEYAGNVYTARNEHGGLGSCTSCHNPHSGQLPADTQIAAKCGTCHFNEAGAAVSTFLELEESRQLGFEGDIDGDANATESLKAEIDGLGAALYSAIQSYAQTVAGAGLCVADNRAYVMTNALAECGITGGPNAVAYNRFTPRLLKAVYNYLIFQNDVGGWAHNPRYTIEVLFDSIYDLRDGGATASTTVKRAFMGHFGGSEDASPYAAMVYHGATTYSGTSDTVGTMGFTGADCYQCHGGNGGLTTYLGMAGTGIAMTDPTYANSVTVKNNKVNALQCSTCHAFSGTTMTHLRNDVTNVYFPPQKPAGKFVAIPADSFGTRGAICATCHTGRENKQTLDDKIAAVQADPAWDPLNAWSFTFVNPHYLGAAGVIAGDDAQMLYQYGANVYAGFAANGDCVGCHQPALTRHSFEVNPTDTTFRADIAALTAELYAAIQGYADAAVTAGTVGATRVCYKEAYPYWTKDLNGDFACTAADTGSPKLDEKLFKATFNYKWAMTEKGAASHNYAYIAQILYDGIVDLTGAAPTSVLVNPVPGRP